MPEAEQDTARLSARTLLAVWFVLALLAAPVLWRMSAPGLSDIDQHAAILVDGMANGTIPWYSAWYPLLYVATLGQATGYDDLRVPSVVLLSIAMGAKGAVALWVLGRARARRWVTLAAVLFVMLVVPLKLGAATNFYLGKVTPTIWHNSTTILAMPFSLLLFVVAVDVLRRAEARWTATAGLAALLVLSLSTKPNYGLLFLPVFGIYALVLAVRGSGPDRWRPLGRYVVVAVVGVAVLGLQYWGTYATGAVTYENRLDPLAVWRAFARDVPLALAESLLLPVVATAVLWRGAVDRASIVLAWSCTALGIAIFMLLGEFDPASGTPVFHGNWSWGMQVAMFVLVVVLTAEWLRQLRSLTSPVKVVVGALALVQLLTGFAYLAQLVESSSYI